MVMRRGDSSMPSVVMSSKRVLPDKARVSPWRVAPTGAGVVLHIEVFQNFVDQHGGPDDAFEDSQHAKPKCCGMAKIVDPCADQAESVDGL
jgi:hypothetical protein